VTEAGQEHGHGIITSSGRFLANVSLPVQPRQGLRPCRARQRPRACGALVGGGGSWTLGSQGPLRPNAGITTAYELVALRLRGALIDGDASVATLRSLLLFAVASMPTTHAVVSCLGTTSED
jgi:hypothetical protein